MTRLNRASVKQPKGQVKARKEETPIELSDDSDPCVKLSLTLPLKLIAFYSFRDEPVPPPKSKSSRAKGKAAVVPVKAVNVTDKEEL